MKRTEIFILAGLTVLAGGAHARAGQSLVVYECDVRDKIVQFSYYLNEWSPRQGIKSSGHAVSMSINIRSGGKSQDVARVCVASYSGPSARLSTGRNLAVMSEWSGSFVLAHFDEGLSRVTLSYSVNGSAGCTGDASAIETTGEIVGTGCRKVEERSWGSP